MKKRLLALVLAVVTMLSISIAPCYAANSVTVMFTSSVKTVKWESTGARCVLNGYKRGKLTKNGSVKVTFNSTYVSKYGTYAMDIAMKDADGRTIWAENDSIVAKKSLSTSRTYKLGKDHSEYRLFFRPSTTKLNAAAYVTVGNPKNCDLSMCYY